MRRLIMMISALLLVGFFATTGYCGETAKTTLDALQAAFNGESNATANYAAFAKKADLEGYTKVASLFRAASKAESIHAAGLAAVIKEMGATPKADLKAAAVKSTKENLEAALAGESYERDTMYPEFIKLATADKNDGALRMFKGAMAAETEHAKFYTEALANLAKWKGGKKEFFVCSVCGYTVDKIDFTNCPVCGQPKEKYVTVK